MKLRFYKGIKIENMKSPADRVEVLHIIPESKVAVPLFSLGNSQIQTTINIGEDIRKNEVLAQTASQNHTVHAPISGTLSKIETMHHPLVGKLPFAILSVNKKDSVKEEIARLFEKVATTEKEKIIDIAKKALIIDEYDGEPLYRKLRRSCEYDIDVVIANAIDDEPYLSSATASLLSEPNEACMGLEIIASLLCANQTEIAVVDIKKNPLIKSLPQTIRKTTIRKFSGNYPLWAGIEKYYKIRKKSYIKIGVQACIAMYKAFVFGQSQTNTVVTVCGSGVLHSQNYNLPIGTPIGDLIKITKTVPCDTIKNEKQEIIMGTAIHGKKVIDLTMPITANTRSVLIMNNVDYKTRVSCIGCSLCTDVCPAGIIPVLIAKAHERKEIEKTFSLGIDRCINCSCCSVVCPVGNNLHDMMKDIKDMKKSMEDA